MSKQPGRIAYFLAALCLTWLLSGCAPSAQTPSDVGQSSAPSTQPPAAVTTAPTSEPAPTSTPSSTSDSPYTFGTYVEESDPVDDSWFGSAAFLGDSRTEGLKAFSGLQYGDFFFSRGMNVFRVDHQDYKVVTINGKNYTILEALALKEYQSVYIMMGINELGYPLESYRSGLSKLLERVIEIQPHAVIYLQTLPPVNETSAQENHLNASINNTNVANFNQVIGEMAQKYQVVLVNTAEAYQDEHGSLPADLASDGVHFAPSAYRRWVDYLARHTMSFQRFDDSRNLASTPQHSEEVHET